MALVYGGQGVEARLAGRGLSRRGRAAAAGMSEADLALAYKDQRELSPDEVGVFAEVLGVSAAEIARQAGVSTPVPGAGPEARIAALERKVAALEADLARLLGRNGQG